MADAAALRVLETRTYDSLAADFKEEFCILERQLYAKLAKPRLLGGAEVTGETIARPLTPTLRGKRSLAPRS